MAKLSRRRLLAAVMGAMAVPAVWADTVGLMGLTEVPSANAGRRDANRRILGGGRFLDSGGKHHVLGIFDPASGWHQEIPTAFYPHGIHFHPQQPQRLALFEKKGPGACELDLHQRQPVRTIDPRPGRHFYGHGCYSADNRYLFSTETRLEDGRGFIGMRDADSLEYLGDFPSFGREPHECKLIDQGKVMVITNAGGPAGQESPCVSWVETHSGQLLHQTFLTNPDLNTGHLAIAADGALVVASAPRSGLAAGAPGGVSIQPRGGDMISMAAPAAVVAAMTGEALSIAIENASGLALVTHPDADMVTLWSIQDQQFVARIAMDKPRGVCISDGHFLVCGGRLQPQLFRLAATADRAVMAQTVPELLPLPCWITGSHLFVQGVLPETGYPAQII